MNYALKRKIHQDDQEDDDADDDEEYETTREVSFSCSKILMLPFEPVWHHLLMILSCITMAETLVNVNKIENEDDVDDFNLKISHFVFYAIYFFDTMLVIICKNSHGMFISPLEFRRPNVIIVLDLLSVLPLELLVTNSWWSLLKLNGLLKLVRVLYYMHYQLNMIGTNQIAIQLGLYVIGVTIVMVLSTAGILNILCNTYYRCVLVNTSTFEDVHGALTQTTGRGFTEVPTFLGLKVTAMIATFFTFIFITVVKKAFITNEFVNKDEHKYNYACRQNIVYKSLINHNIDPELLKNYEIYFELLWQTRKAYSDTKELEFVLPTAVTEELNLDVSWNALQHSKLFKNMNVPFLRLVSKFMKQRYLVDNEILFKKNQLKNKMVYIVSGIVQFLSEQDVETPVLSFSSGTCLGEYSLLYDQKASTSVRVRGFCQVHVLDRRDLYEIIVKFPRNYRTVVQRMRDRITDAKNLKQVANFAKQLGQGKEKTQAISMQWIQATLHRLMMKDTDSATKHECPNLFLRDQFNDERFEGINFTARYLDLYAISERLELVTETSLLTTTFPVILQPDTIILRVWECIIVILALTSGFIIPYYAFVEPDTPLWFIPFVYFVSLVWCTDLFIQMTTAVRSRGEALIQFSSILKYRLEHSVGTWFDIIAAFPVELLASIIVYDISDQSWASLYLNRVLKMRRLTVLLGQLENKITTNVTRMKYIKALFLLGYILFIGGCALYYMNCFNNVCEVEPPARNILRSLLWYYFSATQIVTGAGLRSIIDGNLIYIPIYVLLTVTSNFIFVVTYSFVAAGHVLERSARSKVQTILSDVKNVMINNNLNQSYEQRIVDFVETQWFDNDAADILAANTAAVDVPAQFQRIINENAFVDLFKQVPIFQEMPADLVSSIALISTSYILPIHEVVSYSGSVSNYFHVICQGTCKVISRTTGLIERTIGPTDSINVLETCAGVPVVHTTIAATYCRLVKVDWQKMVSVIRIHPKYMLMVPKIVTDQDVKARVALLYTRTYVDVRTQLQGIVKTQRKSFHNFGKDLALNSWGEYDYYFPFDSLRQLSFVRFFLMRRTIMPDGKFLFVWESARCVFAFLSSLLFTINYIGTCYDCFWFPLLIFLDLTAWADLYVRLHVCYYNEAGILIKHPLTTAKYYLKHSFIVDFMGLFPMKLFIWGSSPSSKTTLTFLQFNRVIQMYRYFRFFIFLEKETLLYNRTIMIFKYFPKLLLLGSLFGTIYINVACDFSSELKATEGSVFGDGIVCKSTSWITTSKFMKPMTTLRALLYGAYVATSVLTSSGISGFQIEYFSWATMVAATSILGFIFVMHMIACIEALYSSMNSSLLMYQEMMQSLRKFMDRFSTPKYLQVEIINHYELLWQKNRGREVHEIIKYLHHPLREDLTFEIYGKLLMETSVFSGDSEFFFRSLLLYCTHHLVMNGGFIARLSDVKDELHLLYKGSVDVIAPDGSKLTSLHVGSIFGNLENYPMTRQTISIVATGHIEILTIKSVKFYWVLNYYPNLLYEFKILTAIHIDYLPGRVENNKEEVPLKSGKSCRDRIFTPNTFGMRVWNAFVLIVVCCIVVALELYQLAVNEYAMFYICLQYFCDVMYYIDFYIKLHTAYRTEAGTYVADIKLIRKRNFKNNWNTRLALISMVPIDVFIWVIPMDSNRQLMLFKCFRINRLLRFNYVYQYFYEQSQMLNINLYVMKLIYIFLWAFSVIHFFTCILLAPGCIIKPNMEPPMECFVLEMSSKDRFKIYLDNMYVIVCCFFHVAQDHHFPQSPFYIFYFIVLMVVLDILVSMLQSQIFAVIQMGCLKQNRYAAFADKMRFFMLRERVSLLLHQKTWDYLRLLWKYDRGTSYPTFLSTAPKYLQESILNASFSQHVKHHKIFSKCHEDFLRQMVAYLHNTTYFPGDYIVFRGTINETMYFIHSGNVTVLGQDSYLQEVKVATLKPGESFGVMQGLFTRRPHGYTFSAKKFTVVLELRKSQWEYLLDFFPASKAMIYQKAKEKDTKIY